MTFKDFSCSILNKNYIEISNKNSSVLLKPPLNLELLFNQYNNSSPEQQNDPENVVNSRYFNIDQIQSLEFCQKEKSLSLFRINTCSLNKTFDDLVYLLKCKNKNFDIIAVSETKISKKTSLTSNINLNNYYFETTPTESTAGGTMFYVSNHFSYKSRTDLNMYKKDQLESTFIETINSKKSNIVVSCVYKHPNMDVLDFNSLINQLLDKISKEQKQIFLLGDFNINLLNYTVMNTNPPMNF